MIKNSNKGNYYWYNMYNGGKHILFLTPQQAEEYSKSPILNLTLIPTKKKEETFSKRRKYGRS